MVVSSLKKWSIIFYIYEKKFSIFMLKIFCSYYQSLDH